jgi:hypothetical protein
MDAAHGHPHNDDGTEMTKEQIAAGGGGHDDHHHEEDGSGWNSAHHLLRGHQRAAAGAVDPDAGDLAQKPSSMIHAEQAHPLLAASSPAHSDGGAAGVAVRLANAHATAGRSAAGHDEAHGHHSHRGSGPGPRGSRDIGHAADLESAVQGVSGLDRLRSNSDVGSRSSSPSSAGARTSIARASSCRSECSPCSIHCQPERSRA